MTTPRRRRGIALAATASVALLGLGAGCASAAPRVDRDDVIAETPLTTEERLAVGTALEGQGDLAAARREYRAVLDGPDARGADAAAAGLRAVVLTNLANTWVGEDRENACELYEEALAEDPGYGVAMNNLALVLVDAGAPREAVPLLVRAVAVDPANRPYYLASLATAYRSLGDPVAARKLLEEVIAGGVADGALVAEVESELATVDAQLAADQDAPRYRTE